MNKHDPDAILDDLLSRWHTWSTGYSPIPTRGADPMFAHAKSSRSWDSADDILDAEVNASIMETLDFQVGEMQDPRRSAIYCVARNCAAGVAVWRSPRLPADALERNVIVQEARNELMRRLLKVGVMQKNISRALTDAVF